MRAPSPPRLPGTPHDTAARPDQSPVSRSASRHRCRYRAVASRRWRQVSSGQSSLRAAATSGTIHQPPRRDGHQNPARGSPTRRPEPPASLRLDHRPRSTPIGRDPRSAASFNQASVQSRTPPRSYDSARDAGSRRTLIHFRRRPESTSAVDTGLRRDDGLNVPVIPVKAGIHVSRGHRPAPV